MLDAVIEGLVALFTWLFEALAGLAEWAVHAGAWMIEAIAGLFIASASEYGPGQLLLWALVSAIELLLWAIVLLWAALAALILRGAKPQIARPRLWRPQPRVAGAAQANSQQDG